MRARREQLSLNWIEQGGPPVSPPSRKGFGHVVIGEMVERSLNGKVAMEFAARRAELERLDSGNQSGERDAARRLSRGIIA